MDASAMLELADRWDVATGDGDGDAMAELAEPSLAFWHNHDDLEVGLEATIRTIAWLRRTVPDLEWHDVDVQPTPTGWVAQKVMTGAAPGGPLRAHTCVVVTVSDRGRVARVAEYLDPAALAVLTA